MSAACRGRPSCGRYWCARIRATPMTRQSWRGSPGRGARPTFPGRGAADIVRGQVAVGVDIVNDGEMSNPGYSTYVADRLSGFAGHEPAKPRLDTRDHPNFMAAYERMTGANVARRSVCVGPIAVRDREPLNQDIANLRDALAQVGVAEGFMT